MNHCKIMPALVIVFLLTIIIAGAYSLWSLNFSEKPYKAYRVLIPFSPENGRHVRKHYIDQDRSIAVLEISKSELLLELPNNENEWQPIDPAVLQVYSGNSWMYCQSKMRSTSVIVGCTNDSALNNSRKIALIDICSRL